MLGRRITSLIGWAKSVYITLVYIIKSIDVLYANMKIIINFYLTTQNMVFSIFMKFNLSNAQFALNFVRLETENFMNYAFIYNFLKW